MELGDQVSRRRWIARSQLIYALAVFIGPVTTGGGWLAWSLTIGSLLTFTYLYLDFVRHSTVGTSRAFVDLVLMAALGFGLLPFNIAATTYVVYAAALVPFLLAGVAGVDSLNQADGIHPTPAGQRILADTVWPVLLEALGHQH